MQQIPDSNSSALTMMWYEIISARKLTEIFLARIAQANHDIKAWFLVDAVALD